MSTIFKALRIIEVEGVYTKQFVQRSIDDLPPNNTLVKVSYSALNFKDALSANGNKGVTKKYPHTPGIDAVGTIVETSAENWKIGDKVIVTGFDLGMNTDGGFAEYIRVPSEWLVKLPVSMSEVDAMIFGTAGLTAAMCIDKLISNGLKPSDGEVVVTGSTGAVGSMAVLLLSHLGFDVVAVSGKTEAHDFLIELGAKRVISREEAIDISGRPLLKGIYAGVVDAVGGEMLATLLKSLKYNGAASICGLVGSPDLPTSVFPFILRGITLFGIDSAEASIEWQTKLWHLLAKEWKPTKLENSYRVVDLDNIIPEIDTIYQGKQMGKVVVKIG